MYYLCLTFIYGIDIQSIFKAEKQVNDSSQSLLCSTRGGNKKLDFLGITLGNRHLPHKRNLYVKPFSFTWLKVPSYWPQLVHGYGSFALVWSKKLPLMKIDSGFRVPGIKDLKTVLQILAIKTSKQKSTAILSVLDSVFPAKLTVVCSPKGIYNLSELIPALQKGLKSVSRMDKINSEYISNQSWAESFLEFEKWSISPKFSDLSIKTKIPLTLNAMEGSLTPDISVKIYAYFQFSKPCYMLHERQYAIWYK